MRVQKEHLIKSLEAIVEKLKKPYCDVVSGGIEASYGLEDRGGDADDAKVKNVANGEIRLSLDITLYDAEADKTNRP